MREGCAADTIVLCAESGSAIQKVELDRRLRCSRREGTGCGRFVQPGAEFVIQWEVRVGIAGWQSAARDRRGAL